MIGKKMHERLQAQVQMEWESEFIYLSMGAWCYNNDFDGFGLWLIKHGDEEREHGMKILRYLSEADAKITIPSVSVKATKFESVRQIFEKALEHEMAVTASCNELVELALSEKDHMTHHFLQWFMQEQLEEEVTFRNIVNQLKRVGDHPNGLFMIEKSLAAQG